MSKDLRENGFSFKDGELKDKVIRHTDLPSPLDLGKVFRDISQQRLDLEAKKGGKEEEEEEGSEEDEESESEDSEDEDSEEADDSEGETEDSEDVTDDSESDSDETDDSDEDDSDEDDDDSEEDSEEDAAPVKVPLKPAAAPAAKAPLKPVAAPAAAVASRVPATASIGKRNLAMGRSIPISASQLPRLAQYILDLESGKDTCARPMKEHKSKTAAKIEEKEALKDLTRKERRRRQDLAREKERAGIPASEPSPTPMLKKIRDWERGRKRVAKFGVVVPADGGEPVLVL